MVARGGRSPGSERNRLDHSAACIMYGRAEVVLSQSEVQGCSIAETQI